MAQRVNVRLEEWQTASPETHPQLRRRFLAPGHDRLVQELSPALQILELRDGLSIKSSQFVGRVEIGDISITVLPKLRGMPLLRLLRYAYGLRDLKLFPVASFAHTEDALQELLIAQLVAEADELIARGISRRYLQTDELLGNPRGRLNIQRMARLGPNSKAALPCTHYPRSEDFLPNQILLAGLRLAAGITRDLTLRMAARRSAALVQDQVSDIRLSDYCFSAWRRINNRLLAVYRPAMTLVKLLYSGQGISLEEESEQIELQGFLFDMNLFFQNLLLRFLNDNLDVRVKDQYPLRAFMNYVEGFNPRKVKDPRPRPDFALLRGAKVVGFLDAKYRDLWENSLPDDMLYQLAMYAINRQSGGSATILYPTLELAAEEARIEVHFGAAGADRATVIQRPVRLDELDRLISWSDTAQARAARRRLAGHLAFGATPAARAAA